MEKVEQVDEDGEDSDGNYDDDEFDAWLIVLSKFHLFCINRYVT